MKAEFETLYRDHYRRVYGLCLRLLRSPAQAEEAAQETFVRAYRSFDGYDAAQAFASWVLGIASNHCIDLIRRRSLGTGPPGVFGDGEAEIAELESQDPDATQMLEDAERGAELRAAIAALPDRYRLPIVLAYYNEWSYEEIAAELGVTRNHVGVLLLRARRSLRRSLATTAEESEP